MKVAHTLTLSLLLTLSSATTARAEDKLKSINDANGGRIVYGQVEGQTTETGTQWNQTADAMVRNDPQRYEYVETPNLRKGRDY
jgi:hypothetical protein